MTIPYIALIEKVIAEERHVVQCESQKQAYRIKRRFYDIRKAVGNPSHPNHLLYEPARAIMVSIGDGDFPTLEFSLKNKDDELVEKSLTVTGPKKVNDPAALLSQFFSEAAGNLSPAEELLTDKKV